MNKKIASFIFLLVTLVFSPALLAAEEGEAAAAANQKQGEAAAAEGDGKQKAKKSNEIGTNIIGTQEAPTVMNIVPWKDREVKMEKKEATSATLKRVLQPLDRDELMREVQYFDMLEQSRQ